MTIFLFIVNISVIKCCDNLPRDNVKRFKQELYKKIPTVERPQYFYFQHKYCNEEYFYDLTIEHVLDSFKIIFRFIAY